MTCIALISAVSPFVLGVISYLVFAALIVALFIWSLGALQTNRTLLQLVGRYRDDSMLRDLNWVRPGREGCLLGPGRAINTNNLLMAYSVGGMQLRMQGLWSPVVDMPTVCIPWEFITSRHSAKFGFYKASFEIGGFEDGSLIELRISATDRHAGKCIEQCASAIARNNSGGAEPQS